METVNFSELKDRLDYCNFSIEMSRPLGIENFGVGNFVGNIFKKLNGLGDTATLEALDAYSKTAYGTGGLPTAVGTASYQAAKKAAQLVGGDKAAVTMFGKLFNAAEAVGLSSAQLMQLFPATALTAGAGAITAAALIIAKIVKKIKAKIRLNKGLPPRSKSEAKEMAKLQVKQDKAQAKMDQKLAKSQAKLDKKLAKKGIEKPVIADTVTGKEEVVPAAV